MKKCLIFVLTLFLFVRVQAVTEKYSEWSSEYPKDVSRLLIRSEERYLWYKDIITDENYIMKEFVKDEKIDKNNFVTVSSEESIIEPKGYVSRTIKSWDALYTFKSNDIDSISITFNDSNIYELELYINNDKINYEVSHEYSFLNDNVFDKYEVINNKVDIKLDNKYDIKDILVKLYCVSNDSSIYFTYKSYRYEIYYNNYKLDKDIISIDSSNLIANLNQKVRMYKYIDTLYRTYKVKREYTTDYYTELEGYTRDDSSRTLFYSYLLNDYVILDSHGNIVKNESYCIKNFCSIEIIEEKEGENPKTGDYISYSFIILFFSLVIISMLLFIFYKRIINKNI